MQPKSVASELITDVPIEAIAAKVLKVKESYERIEKLQTHAASILKVEKATSDINVKSIKREENTCANETAEQSTSVSNVQNIKREEVTCKGEIVENSRSEVPMEVNFEENISKNENHEDDAEEGEIVESGEELEPMEVDFKNDETNVNATESNPLNEPNDKKPVSEIKENQQIPYATDMNEEMPTNPVLNHVICKIEPGQSEMPETNSLETDDCKPSVAVIETSIQNNREIKTESEKSEMLETSSLAADDCKPSVDVNMVEASVPSTTIEPKLENIRNVENVDESTIAENTKQASVHLDTVNESGELNDSKENHCQNENAGKEMKRMPVSGNESTSRLEITNSGTLDQSEYKSVKNVSTSSTDYVIVEDENSDVTIFVTRKKKSKKKKK